MPERTVRDEAASVTIGKLPQASEGWPGQDKDETFILPRS